MKCVELPAEDEDDLLANLDLDEIVAQHKQGSLSQEYASNDKPSSFRRPHNSDHISPLRTSQLDLPQNRESTSFRQDRINADSPSYNPRASFGGNNTPADKKNFQPSPEERKRQHLLELQRQKELIERQISALQAEEDVDFCTDLRSRPEEPIQPRNRSFSFPSSNLSSNYSYQGHNQPIYSSSTGSRSEFSSTGSFTTAAQDSFQTPVQRFSSSYESDTAPYYSSRATMVDNFIEQTSNQPFSSAYPQSSPLKVPEQKGGYASENDQQHLNRVDLFGKSQKFDWTEKLRKINKHVFRNPSFRKHQEEIINTILSGHDCFVLMPTGIAPDCFEQPDVFFKVVASHCAINCPH